MNSQQGSTALRLGLWVFSFFLVPFSVSLPRGFAQEFGDISYTRHPAFHIPFQADPADRRIKQVQLYVSNDQGRTWHPYASVRPEDGKFVYTATRDGHHWFTVRTIDQDNRANPLSMENVRPGLKVCVDTQAPVVGLRARPTPDGSVEAEWEIRDENLDPATLNLEYRLQGGVGEWMPLRVEPLAAGRHAWRPGQAGAVEVKLFVRDKAGNEGQARTLAQAEGQGFAGQGAPPAGGPAAVRMVNSERVSLNYELKEVGPSGVSVVELWYTQDGRSWQKHSEDPAARPPYVVNVKEAGVYGFTLVVRSGVGLSDRPPQVGDPPQIWVEVDLTKPAVQLLNVEVGRGIEKGNLTISWNATDKNLGRQPITLSYAEQPTGAWTTIAANLENTGRHVWRMPANVPYKFFVRVEAADRAGNVGAAVTPQPVIVDLSQPKGVIINVEPGK